MRKGFEERAVTVAVPGEAPGFALDARYRHGRGAEGAGALLIAPPHPLHGGSMDSPVAAELAWSAWKAGLASLRFDWRGVGASAGTPSGEARDADADLEAAREHLAASVAGPMVGAGYSFGAAAMARAAARAAAFERLVLVAPPPALLDPGATRALAALPLLVVSGAEDALAPPERLAELLRDHPQAEVYAIPEADHFFVAGLADLGAVVAEWLGAR